MGLFSKQFQFSFKSPYLNSIFITMIPLNANECIGSCRHVAFQYYLASKMPFFYTDKNPFPIDTILFLHHNILQY